MSSNRKPPIRQSRLPIAIKYPIPGLDLKVAEKVATK
jgi:hypothetical protein